MRTMIMSPTIHPPDPSGALMRASIRKGMEQRLIISSTSDKVSRTSGHRKLFKSVNTALLVKCSADSPCFMLDDRSMSLL